MPLTIYMPALSPTMEMGNIVKWHKNEGDSVSSGEVIAEIETDKALMEFEVADDGVLAKILIPEGTVDVKVNEPIAILMQDGESLDDITLSYSSEVSDFEEDVSSSNLLNHDIDEDTVNIDENVTSEEILVSSNINQDKELDKENIRKFITPLAKRIAHDKGIDYSTIEGTGPNGRIVKSDIQNYKLSENNQITQNNMNMIDSNNQYIETPIDSMREVIAKRLQESHSSIPSYALNVDVSITEINKIRKKMNKDISDDMRISINHLLIKVVSLSMIKVPEINSSWAENKILRYKDTDIGIAVAIENGLITPIIKNVNTKGLAVIRDELKDLITRSHEKKLKPSEYQGGTISISNLGSYGIKSFTSIINPPQSCILSVGASRKIPVIKDDSVTIDEVISITLTADHRLIDGAVGAQFLSSIKSLIENPNLMLL
ncbi:MAG: pyruvate dehydrogenase complex dihydrolipoamide acetyltransferase [Rhizobiales bacterium]|nr:pyruvate dehydrogenase complex dihydrolipoamide acetyltransferase [Hyphomicrobiales bacterium]